MAVDGTALQFCCAVCGLLLKQAWQHPASITTQNHLRDFVPSPSIPQIHWCSRIEGWRMMSEVGCKKSKRWYQRCDKRPGKRSFHGKGKTEEKSQSSLWDRLLWLALERGERPRLLSHRYLWQINLGDLQNLCDFFKKKSWKGGENGKWGFGML